MKTERFETNGRSAIFNYRETRNDYYTVLSGYVQDEYDVLSPSLQPGDAAIDIGAHIGTVTVLMAQQGAHVYAYEAIRDNWRMLADNVDANGLTSCVSTYHRAVCGNNDWQTIHLSAIEDVSHHYIGSLYSNVPDTEKVRGITLDRIFKQNQIERCALLKLDAEGAEWDILAASSDDTLKRIKRMTGEYHTVGATSRSRADPIDVTRGLFLDVTETDDPGGQGPFRLLRGQA